jgi:hypothetical protein
MLHLSRLIHRSESLEPDYTLMAGRELSMFANLFVFFASEEVRTSDSEETPPSFVFQPSEGVT